MKVLYLVCLIPGPAFILGAQTNLPLSTNPVIMTALPAGSNAPSGEIRPTEIHSDSGQFYMKSNVFVYRGNVHVDNPQRKLTCDLLIVEAPKLDEGKYNRATALTNVVIDWVDDQGSNHATSDKAVYTYVLTNLSAAPEEHWQTNDTVVLTGNPVVTNLSGTFRGDPIVYDRLNGTITSPNMLKMTINQNTTNTSGMFETAPPLKTAPAPK